MRYVLLMLVVVGSTIVFGQVDQLRKAENPDYSAYLMAYFGPEEKLLYVISLRARNWSVWNNG